MPSHLENHCPPARVCRVRFRDLDGQGDEVLARVGGVQGVADAAQFGPASGADWICSIAWRRLWRSTSSICWQCRRAMRPHRHPCRRDESGVDQALHGMHAMHGLLRGWVGGSGVGAQVQLPNPFNQPFDALKRASVQLNRAGEGVNEGFDGCLPSNLVMIDVTRMAKLGRGDAVSWLLGTAEPRP
ncbi:hypothetical protein [Methylobacterium sp. J-077]|uniref:hypothetical protein n=1 Tax=Methylobacterium sp. J-077 TaxID=2836656 RepID=UPI001FB952C2|nr:hypothetical protein [Methylobacterium sp. J-077]MCJ2121876.1 hypothetical protein [Methylobacterium sp. J-077]